MARKIFLLSPRIALSEYVARLESCGAEVYWPYRDTDQETQGWEICSKNFAAILWANEIHVWFAPGSEDLMFGLGMVVALFRIGLLKKIVIANPEAILPLSRKGLEDVLLRMQEEAAEICAPH